MKLIRNSYIQESILKDQSRTYPDLLERVVVKPLCKRWLSVPAGVSQSVGGILILHKRRMPSRLVKLKQEEC